MNWTDPSVFAAIAAMAGTSLGIIVQKSLDVFTLRTQSRLEVRKHFLTLRFTAAQEVARVLIVAADQLATSATNLRRLSATPPRPPLTSLSKDALTTLSSRLTHADADMRLLIEDAVLDRIKTTVDMTRLTHAIHMTLIVTDKMIRINEQTTELRELATNVTNEDLLKDIAAVTEQRDDMVRDAEDLIAMCEQYQAAVQQAVRVLYASFRKYFV